MPVMPCFLCGKNLDQRTDKNNKPYFICDPCGAQIFIRRKHGIEKLAGLLLYFCKREIPMHRHSQSLHEIQAIVAEIDGIKAEIARLEVEIGILFPDQEKR